MKRSEMGLLTIRFAPEYQVGPFILSIFGPHGRVVYVGLIEGLKGHFEVREGDHTVRIRSSCGIETVNTEVYAYCEPDAELNIGDPLPDGVVKLKGLRRYVAYVLARERAIEEMADGDESWKEQAEGWARPVWSNSKFLRKTRETAQKASR